MVDAGSRAASVTIHRVMDTERGLDNVTKSCCHTLLNHWIKYYGKPITVRTDPEVAFRDQGVSTVVLLPRVSALDIDLGDPSWQTGSAWEVTGYPSNSQQYVWLEELLTVSHFKKSLMNSPRLTMTYNEIEDSLRGSCCWERHRQTSQFAKMCSVEVVDNAAKQRLSL